MSAAKRIKIKYFVEDPAAVDMSTVTPVFHRWIHEHRVGGLLLDVADYKHVQNGPGIVLIGHDADHSLDTGDGRPGLVYDHKRNWGENGNGALSKQVRTVISGGLHGCQAFAAEPEFNGRVRFRLDEVDLTFVDRLETPNQPAVYAAVTTEVRPVLDGLYGAGNYTLTRLYTDERRALTVRINACRSPEIATLISKLGG